MALRSRWVFRAETVLSSVVLCAATGCAGGPDEIAGGATGAVAGGGKPSGGNGGTNPTGGTGHGGTGGVGGSGGTPAFQCSQTPASSPALAAKVLFDPAEPHPGDTLTVVIVATNGTTSSEAPEMDLEVTIGAGTSAYSNPLVIGGPATYIYEVPGLALGDVCVLSRIGGQPEASAKVTVTPRPAGPPAQGGIYKVTTNHQFTCDEQPDWGNELHVSVRDANGQGVPNAQVSVRLPDWTDRASIKNADSHPVPSVLSTDGSGNYDDYFWWPSNAHGYTVFELSVKDAASDRATEITSGWWETDSGGCRYCPNHSLRNVYGHWSHRIVFQLDPSVSDACVVPTDHAGQSACGAPGHVQHTPNASACWTAK